MKRRARFSDDEEMLGTRAALGITIENHDDRKLGADVIAARALVATTDRRQRDDVADLLMGGRR